MASPQVEAAAASTRTEFEARGLTALKAAAIAAKAAYYDHKYSGDPNDMDAQIAFDIEEARLQREHFKAEETYKAELRKLVSA